MDINFSKTIFSCENNVSSNVLGKPAHFCTIQNVRLLEDGRVFNEIWVVKTLGQQVIQWSVDLLPHLDLFINFECQGK